MSLTSVDFPDPLTPVTAVSTPSGILTSRFFRLFARAPRMTISPFSSGRRAFGVGMTRAPVRYAPVSEKGSAVSSMSACGRALEDDVAAVVAGAGSEIDDVVGGADRLLVVLDDDHGVAEIAQPRQRREQLPVVALVQADRRLVEHVEHAR